MLYDLFRLLPAVACFAFAWYLWASADRRLADLDASFRLFARWFGARRSPASMGAYGRWTYRLVQPAIFAALGVVFLVAAVS